MQNLFEEESWKLFCLFAFSDTEENRPPKHLDDLAHQIVDKCGGLPLVVKTVAASMSSSVVLGYCESKLRRLKDVVGAEDSTMQILKLSYDSLPTHLKSCFASFSSLPEHTQICFYRNVDPKYIYQDSLIYLWIAEGFIPQENEKEQWDMGLDYLHQLVNLCLVELNAVDACYNMHDLLHDLAINISKQHKCAFHLPLQETSCRRLLLCKKGMTNDAVSEIPLHRHHQFLRTLSLFQNPDIKAIPEHLFDYLRLLRVLDLSCTSISALPSCVGKLKLLKLLNLSQTKITELPDCVRRLKSLQYLDISGCTAMQRVPRWIGEITTLSHLDIRSCSEEAYSHMPRGISMLRSLRTLRSDEIPVFTVENHEFLTVKDVGNLINLQEMAISLEDVGGLSSVENGILERLVKMRILAVRNNTSATENDNMLPAFPAKMNVMKDLRELSLTRFSVPSWICGMGNLAGLLLSECCDYPSLQTMPNLQRLALKGDWRSRELPKRFGERGGFPKLVRLFIIDFSRLEELPVLEEGAMQRLEGLSINKCPRVKKIPEGLERLRKLRLIEVVQASGELEKRLEEGGEDWNKIKVNNPQIQIKLINSI